MKRISVEPLTAQAFSSFGSLLDGSNVTKREDHVVIPCNDREEAALNVALVRAAKPANQQGEVLVNWLERHPRSSQTFFPLDVKRYLVVVAPDTGAGAPDTTALRAFSVPGNIGVHYHVNTWHYGMSSLNGGGVFAMMIHEDGSADDCEIRSIAPVFVDTATG